MCQNPQESLLPPSACRHRSSLHRHVVSVGVDSDAAAAATAVAGPASDAAPVRIDVSAGRHFSRPGAVFTRDRAVFRAFAAAARTVIGRRARQPARRGDASARKMDLGGWSVVSMQKASPGDAAPRGAFYEVCGISAEMSRKFCAAPAAGPGR